MTLIDTINGINEMILSDDISSSHIDTLKSARKYLESLNHEMVQEDCMNEVEKAIKEGIPKVETGREKKYRETRSKGSKERTYTNPYKRKSSGKMGKRCVYCGHFNKYDKVGIKNTRCIGRCTLFDIQVNDTFNGCTQEDGALILHNFDPEEVAKLKIQMEVNDD